MAKPVRVIVSLPEPGEFLEVRYIEEDREIVVLRHGKYSPEGGEAIWSEVFDDTEDR